MTTGQAKQLRADFAAWTGSESGSEISTFIESSLGVDVDPNEALDEFLRWPKETDAEESAAVLDYLNGRE